MRMRWVDDTDKKFVEIALMSAVSHSLKDLNRLLCGQHRVLGLKFTVEH